MSEFSAQFVSFDGYSKDGDYSQTDLFSGCSDGGCCMATKTARVFSSACAIQRWDYVAILHVTNEAKRPRDQCSFGRWAALEAREMHQQRIYSRHRCSPEPRPFPLCEGLVPRLVVCWISVHCVYVTRVHVCFCLSALSCIPLVFCYVDK